MPPSPEVIDKVSHELSRHPAGLSIKQLGRTLAPIREPQISAALSELQRCNRARPTGARWRWIGPPLQHSSTRPDPPSKGVLPGSKVTPIASRWDVFRRLCLYYREFVRLEEKAQVRVYANKENQDFIQIPGAIDWSTLEQGKPVKALLSPEAAVFLRRGRSGHKLPYWFLGLPVDVSTGKDRNSGADWIALEPILVMAVSPEVDGEGMVTLHPSGSLEVNPGWLQRRFKWEDERREFLATVGLEDSSPRDSEEEQEQHFRIGSFREAILGLEVAYKKLWREYLDLDELQTSPPLQELRQKGFYNRALLVSQPRLKYANRLYGELDQLADPAKISDSQLDRSALAFLFPHTSPPSSEDPPKSGNDAPPDHCAEYQPLNHEQRDAVCSATRRPLTVLTGPPGTGKSITVAHTMANLALERRPVLFASRNHQAIDVVEQKLNAVAEPEILVMRPARASGPDERTQEWRDAITEALTRPHREEARDEFARQSERLRTSIEERAAEEGQMHTLLDLIDEHAERQQACDKSLHILPESLRPLAAAGPHAPTPSCLSALIYDLEQAQRTGTAWYIRMGHMLLEVLRGIVRRRRDTALQTRCAAALSAIGAAADSQLQHPNSEKTPLATLRKALREAEDFCQAADAAHQLAAVREQLESRPGRDELEANLEAREKQVHSLTQSSLQLLAENAGAELEPATRQRFAELRAGLDNHRDMAAQDKFTKAFAKALPELLQHFPLWAISNLSAYKAAPLAPGTFDLLIVDEASQCDIPSVVPLLFRARRALIVGDPLQLGHITKMPRPMELRLRNRFGLVGDESLERFSVGTNSMYDLAASAATVDRMIQLKAHYRCHPDIAAYCNDSFYKNTLRVMTNVAKLKRIPGMPGTARGIEWTNVKGPITPAASGCHAPAHVDAIVKEIEHLIDAGFDGSLGVVTPFRVQADRIRDAVHAHFSSAQLGVMQFHCHTVDGFQGDERDVILFSLVGGPDMPEGSEVFLGRTPNRFNVAISRARSFVRIFGDHDWAKACRIQHIRKLAKLGDGKEKPYAFRSELVGPVWEPLLSEVMRDSGLDFFQQYPACGYYLDFAILEGDRRLNIEVDGEAWHRAADGTRLIDDLYRDRTLRGAGWKVLRFWVYELKEDLDGCLRRIQKACEPES